MSIRTRLPEIKPTIKPDEFVRRRELATLGPLWEKLNDPRQHRTPQVVIEAIAYSVRTRGLAALEEPETFDRLATCDEAAKAEINSRIEKLLDKRAPA